MASSKDKPKRDKKGPKKPEGQTFQGDSISLGSEGRHLMKTAGAVGIIPLVLSVALGMAKDDGFKQFYHSYLVAFMWVLSISLGALWWVTLQHLVNAKWSIVVRRLGEILAQGLPLMAALALPLVIPMLRGDDALYLWVNQETMHADHLLHEKVPYLNTTFFAVRFVIYFGFWSLLARYYLKSSLAQDQQGGEGFLKKWAKVAPPSMIAIALTLTFCAVDFLMSLDPIWFSTIFGVYYFAGCVLAVHSTMALGLFWLQRHGRLTKSVTIEHYHDIGKMMFAFTVFWAYIAFSQFMLIWYANVPEETHWYKMRFEGEWAWVSGAQLVAHFVIPFFGLLSRHVKRNPLALSVGAVWVLVVHFIDLHWLVMPNLHTHGFTFEILDVTTWIGLAALLLAFVLFQAQKVQLLVTNDPRLKKSLAFENI